MTVQSSETRDEQYNKPKSSYFNLPALDVSIAFPQATPASIFPPCTSDYYQLDELLTPEEQAIRMKVRECMEKEIAPIMAKYWEKAEFPFHVVPKLGALGIAGGTIKGYGCPGLSITANAITIAELARVDASIATFVLVHSSLAMLTIDEQYNKPKSSYFNLPALDVSIAFPQATPLNEDRPTFLGDEASEKNNRWGRTTDEATFDHAFQID